MPTIPDYRWGRRHSGLSRLGTRFAATGFGSWAIRRAMPLDRKILLRTDGRRTLLGPLGAPIMVLETTGAKSGLMRHHPLLFARDGDSVVVVGSNFGQAHHPAWTANLLANPRAVVITGGTRVPVTATLLHGSEADDAYARLEEETSVYAEYRRRTHRQIRVFRLTPTP